MTSEQMEAAKRTLVALINEYASIMRNVPAGSRKELLEDLARRVREAKNEYGLKQDLIDPNYHRRITSALG